MDHTVEWYARKTYERLDDFARFSEQVLQRPLRRYQLEIAEAIHEHVQPRGVGVVIEAMHFCMMMRGVEKQNSVAVTSCTMALLLAVAANHGRDKALIAQATELIQDCRRALGPVAVLRQRARERCRSRT